MRTAKFILLTIWEEIFFYTVQAMYQRYNGYIGTSLFESWSLTVLGTRFTSLCVIVPGLFEHDLRAETMFCCTGALPLRSTKPGTESPQISLADGGGSRRRSTGLVHTVGCV
jgi:hypothetical protein